ncbi:hypothetical protein GCM10010310_78940 [Streptomyces violaceolatus]|uniref:Uncharacterized protein n=1 Tax=Streptomyces violaceolatus TaxID=67378 RepID=A0ABN3TKQ4_9ACTN
MILLPFIVALALAGVGVYAAYRNPALGTAILVGVGILGVLYGVLVTDPTTFPAQQAPPSSTAPAEWPTEAHAEQQGTAPTPSVDPGP